MMNYVDDLVHRMKRLRRERIALVLTMLMVIGTATILIGIILTTDFSVILGGAFIVVMFFLVVSCVDTLMYKEKELAQARIEYECQLERTQ